MERALHAGDNNEVLITLPFVQLMIRGIKRGRVHVHVLGCVKYSLSMSKTTKYPSAWTLLKKSLLFYIESKSI